MSLQKYATPNERAIAQRIVDFVLAQECTMSVYDGEEMVVKKSSDRQAILDALATTESDIIHFHNAAGSRLGWVHLVWGNDCDLISDSADNADTTWLLYDAELFADSLLP